MIKDVLDLLRSDDWYEGGELTQLAKGKYKTPTNSKEFYDHFKRNK